jgi:murein DD-endopeptidase MepM/ murein hydrolase activator NlpD
LLTVKYNLSKILIWNGKLIANERVITVEEIITRQRYSHQIGTQKRRKKSSNSANEDMFSTGFAAKMLIVVVVLSVLALCKAADNPTTNSIVAKAKVVTTKNYNTDKYIMKFASSLGIYTPAAAGGTDAIKKDNKTPDAMQTGDAAMDKTSLNTQPVSSISGTQNTAAAELQEQPQDPVLLEDTLIKAVADKYSFILPIKGDIASPFGTRIDPFTNKESFHRGIDITANMGTSIKAALNGEVTEASSNAENGQYIVIKHNDGIKTVYSHCSILVAQKGQKVNQGDVIAKVGNTENTSGSYLHFEIWKDNKLIDPEKLFNYLNN